MSSRIFKFEQNKISWVSPLGLQPLALQFSLGPHTILSDVAVLGGTWSDLSWDSNPLIVGRSPIPFSSPTTFPLIPGIYNLFVRIPFRDDSASGTTRNVDMRAYDVTHNTSIRESSGIAGALGTAKFYDFEFNVEFELISQVDIKLQVMADVSGYTVPSNVSGFMTELSIIKKSS